MHDLIEAITKLSEAEPYLYFNINIGYFIESYKKITKDKYLGSFYDFLEIIEETPESTEFIDEINALYIAEKLF